MTSEEMTGLRRKGNNKGWKWRASIGPARGKRSDGRVQERGELRFGHCADLRLGDLTVLEQHQGRNPTDAEFCSRLGVFVNIEFCDHDLVAVFLGDFLQDGCNHLAGAAPGCPVIDQHRFGGLEDIRFKGGIAHVLDVIAHGVLVNWDELAAGFGANVRPCVPARGQVRGRANPRCIDYSITSFTRIVFPCATYAHLVINPPRAAALRAFFVK